MLRFTQCIALASILLLPLTACEPEYVESSVEGGWISAAVNACEGRDGKEPHASCAGAAECTYYCCECESGNQYTVAGCYEVEGCASFIQACDLAQPSMCD